MGIPWRVLALNSAAAAVFLAIRQEQWSKLSLAGNFASAWLLQFSAYAVWSVFLYPWYFSPLIGLPEAAGGHWLLGHFRRISKEPTGVPHQDWYETLPCGSFRDFSADRASTG